jgi:hypothetical protein
MSCSKKRALSAIGLAQIWMQILFKMAQFWMPFNSGLVAT